MARSLYDRIWLREAGGGSTTANIRGIYGSKEWVNDLDIVNELGGHTGCVNALRYVRDPLPSHFSGSLCRRFLIIPSGWEN
jgi:nuclear receptor interaction protein